MNAPRLVLPLLVASLLLCGIPATAEEPKRAAQPPQVAMAEALARLEAGNRRYMAGKLMHPRQHFLNDQILGSIEYADEHLGARVVVVLGHERCGAVKATKESLVAKAEAPPHINSLVSAIRPAVEAAPGADLEAMTHANIRYVVQGLRSSAPTLKRKADALEIAVVGAYYDLDTGKVAFLEGAQDE